MSYAVVLGAAALLVPQGLSSVAEAEPASADCAPLQRVETGLAAKLNELKPYAQSLSAVLALDPNDPDRQAVGEILSSMADTLQTGAAEVTTESYRNSLERFAALFDRGAQLVQDGEEASPEDIKRFKEQGEDLGNSVDTAYAHACNVSVRS